MRSRELTLSREGIKIRAWLYFPEPAPTRLLPALIFCHGIPGSKPDPHDRGYIPLFEECTGLGFACATFNFRGCGLSGGNIDMRGWHQDLDAVIDAVQGHPGIDPSSVHCIGFSAGGAIAAKIVSYQKEVASLLLVASPQNFSDILPADPSILKDHFLSIGLIRDESFPHDLEGWYRDFLGVDPAHWLPFIHPRPVGVVHGDCDGTVPVNHAEKLFDAAWEPKKLTILRGAGHQLRKDPRIMQVLRDWLSAVC
ncbi:MAG TPA: alpha/beta fold hydrolase [Deltaproteobacteria bacterium]|nr:alpha/beta fold hydrolase [Deltaproteobacteria bacterium]HRW79858.1 alpha/beta fold hydrolase [Desulfomonilia bacterium]NMD41552.1 alpha/beta fold hydrolase [Deltaproteobacteria bacterium]HNQ85349.1 alpha/beta fold hydrolase [Deltaproteobacteria bacterium]HNS89361.1 alpha/beta fold hydrolase [Deltaproteobacteria bacterium]